LAYEKRKGAIEDRYHSFTSSSTHTEGGDRRLILVDVRVWKKPKRRGGRKKGRRRKKQSRIIPGIAGCLLPGPAKEKKEKISQNQTAAFPSPNSIERTGKKEGGKGVESSSQRRKEERNWLRGEKQRLLNARSKDKKKSQTTMPAESANFLFLGGVDKGGKRGNAKNSIRVGRTGSNEDFPSS